VSTNLLAVLVLRLTAAVVVAIFLQHVGVPARCLTGAEPMMQPRVIFGIGVLLALAV
jgi:hypothetical protein